MPLWFRVEWEDEDFAGGKRISIEVDPDQYKLLTELQRMGGSLEGKALIPEFWAQLRPRVEQLFTEPPVPARDALQLMSLSIIYGNTRPFEIMREGPALWNLDMQTTEEVFDVGRDLLHLIAGDPKQAAREFVARLFNYSLSLKPTQTAISEFVFRNILNGQELGRDAISNAIDKLAKIHYALEMRKDMSESMQGPLAPEFDIGFPGASVEALDMWLRGFYLLREPHYFLELSTVVHSLWDTLKDASALGRGFRDAGTQLHMLLARLEDSIVEQLNDYSPIRSERNVDGEIDDINDVERVFKDLNLIYDAMVAYVRSTIGAHKKDGHI